MYETVRDIESDHRDMCRFGSLEDLRYQKVASALRRILQDLSSKDLPITVSNGKQVLQEPHGRDIPNSYEEVLSNEQRKEILDLLRFDQIDARLMSLKTAQAKTCRWILKNSQYTDWLDVDKQRSHNGFFWIKGKPGTGKSTTMKFLFLEAKKRMKGSIVISFFFNARGGDLEKSTLGLYRSLLLQLFEKAPNLKSSIDHCGVHGLELVKQTGWKPEMLKEIFTVAVEMFQGHRLVCYIDALDECPEDDVREMISFFEDLGAQEKSGELLVCFSSRHYPEITIKTGLELILENEQDHREDINLYIESQLKIGDTPQAEDIKAEIVRKASGIFLWVALVVPILNKEHDRGRIKIKQRLDEIPTGLHDLFLDILTRDCKNVEEMSLCIQCVLFAKRPLTPEEIHVSLFTGTEGETQDPFDRSQVTSDILRKFILDSSKGLAQITKSKTPTVQFIHESVRDFLLKEGGIQKLPFIDKNVEGQGHASLRRICLLQLADHMELKLSKIPDTDTHVGPLTRYRFIKDILPEYPFLEYAVQNVLYHADLAERHGAASQSFLQDFPRKTWIFMHNLLEKHEVRRYNAQAHLIYILAESGAAALIRIHPARADTALAKTNCRYDSALIAALYAGNHNSARALCGINSPEVSGPPYFYEHDSNHVYTMKKGTYQKSRGLLSCLAEFGDTILLRAILEHEDMSLHESLSQKFDALHFASSEAVIELLVEFAIGTYSFTELLVPGVESADSTPDECIMLDDEYNGLPFLTKAIKQNSRLVRYNVWAGQTLLAYAAERGFERIAKLAILYTGDVDFTYRRRTEFLYAASGSTNHSGRLEVMKALYKAHLDPGPPDGDGNTPLHYAVLGPFNEEIIKFLVSITEINLEHKNNEGYTALAVAVEENRKVYVDILLAAGADPMLRFPGGSLLLIYAVKMGDMGSFRALLNDPRCEPDARDAENRTALSWCASVSDEVAAKMMSDLIECAAVDLNLRDKNGRTALERSIHSAKPDLVKLLLGSSRLEPDLQNSRGITPLGLSVSLCLDQNCAEFREIAKLLLDSGKVNPLTKNSRGQTLLDIARSGGLNELARLMESFLEGGD
jgi:ankyrin repeat protein